MRTLTLVSACLWMSMLATTVFSLDYQRKVLPTLGGSLCRPYAISSNGLVVGSSLDASGNQQAFLYSTDGGINGLGTLDGDVSSCAVGVNSSGAVVGYSTSAAGTMRAFIWRQDTGMTPLFDVNQWSVAKGIDDSGRIVGSILIGRRVKGFLLNADDSMIISPYGDEVRGINSAGQALCGTSGGYRSAIWNTETNTYNLLAVSPWGSYAVGNDINDSGMVAGWWLIGAHGSACIWTSWNTGVDLGWDGVGQATAINNKGLAVATGGNFVYNVVTHEKTYLEGGTPWDINDAGYIVGYDGNQGVLWEIVPEPSAIGGLLCCLGGSVCLWRRTRGRQC